MLKVVKGKACPGSCVCIEALLTIAPRRDLHPGLVSNPSMCLWLQASCCTYSCRPVEMAIDDRLDYTTQGVYFGLPPRHSSQGLMTGFTASISHQGL
ncbi:hypothetical protein J4Q44_G00123410 [Coregonus suidteri]|uniref:Uncharacterized protein n=1 Tax=Coregonus suidteri TaxID=861788 RepID=A0AAN8QYL2_9TELE